MGVEGKFYTIQGMKQTGKMFKSYWIKGIQIFEFRSRYLTTF